MTDRLAGVRAKLDRADRHTAELKRKIAAFLEREPFVIERQEEKGGRLVFRVRVRQEPPIHISTIIGDAIHALRTSLDLLAGQLVLVNGGTPTRATCFPIAETEGAFRQQLPAALAGASKRAIAAVRSLKPYRTGNANLWLLHHLDIVDKHRLLLTVGCVYTALSLDFAEELRSSGFEWSKDIPEMRLGLKPADRLFPLQDGAEVFAIEAAGRGSGSDMSPQFMFEIAFAGGEVTEGQIVGETLAALRGTVQDTINRVEALLS
jgi:hypothetical protein